MPSLAALATTSGIRPGRAQAVSNSSGTEPPKLKAPANACDCHMHIYDPVRFQMPPSKRGPPSEATVAHYRELQKRNDNKPDDAFLFDLLEVWAPDAATRNRILVANPQTLYGFRPRPA